jgi:hypothetical protein
LIGNGGGGITGNETQNTTIINCYSTGAISDNGGGICGQNYINSTITNCYSTGSIGSNAGGIVGRSSVTVTITNCYSVGAIAVGAGGIIGPTSNAYTIAHCYTVGTTSGGQGYIIGGSASVPATCYSEALTNAPGGSWNSAHADTVLQGLPAPVVGNIWISTVLNQPYELFSMGYTPYTTANIDITGAPALKTIVAATLAAGTATAAAIISGRSYTVLQIVGTSPGSYSSITTDPTTGVISTTGATVPGTYAVYLRNTGSYNITEYELTVTEGDGGLVVPCCARPTFRRGPLIDNTTYVDLVAGNTYIGSVRRNGVNISYDQMMAMKKAQASKTQ